MQAVSAIPASMFVSFTLSWLIEKDLISEQWLASPSCTELESIVFDWASQMLGLSSSFLNSSGVGGGCFQVCTLPLRLTGCSSLLQKKQNTASEAALVAIIAARSAYIVAYPDTKLEDMRIYTTTQTHSLGLKAGVILGLTVRALEVTREDHFSLRGETLRVALEDDKEKGLHPFILSKFLLFAPP